jgi:hypothetical protein
MLSFQTYKTVKSGGGSYKLAKREFASKMEVRAEA